MCVCRVVVSCRMYATVRVVVVAVVVWCVVVWQGPIIKRWQQNVRKYFLRLVLIILNCSPLLRPHHVQCCTVLCSALEGNFINMSWIGSHFQGDYEQSRALLTASNFPRNAAVCCKNIFVNNKNINAKKKLKKTEFHTNTNCVCKMQLSYRVNPGLAVWN